MTTYTHSIQGDNDTALDKGMADCHDLVANNVTVRYVYVVPIIIVRHIYTMSCVVSSLCGGPLVDKGLPTSCNS